VIKTPGTLILLAVTWTICLAAGVGLVWQALMDKSSPSRSRVRRAINEIKFRLGFASGVVLIILCISGLVWVLVRW
jgi:hypothetical protein